MKYKCSMCEDTECILEFKSKDETTTPNRCVHPSRCPHWMAIGKWEEEV